MLELITCRSSPGLGRFFATATLGVVFFASSIGKAISPAPTARVLSQWVEMPAEYVGPTVVGMIALETILAAWLVAGLASTCALWFSAAGLLMASGVIVAMIITQPGLPCGCGLPEIADNPQLSKVIGLARNGFLILVAVSGVLSSQSRTEGVTI